MGDGPAPSRDPASRTPDDHGGLVAPPRVPPVPIASRRPRMLRSLVIGVVIALASRRAAPRGARLEFGKGLGGTGRGGRRSGARILVAPAHRVGARRSRQLGQGRPPPGDPQLLRLVVYTVSKETPLLAKAAAAELAQGGPIRFVGIDVNDPPARALPFVQKAGITYPVGVDQTFRVTSGLYGLFGLPQTFVIDSGGRVVAHIIGAVNAADLRSWMKKLDADAAASGRSPSSSRRPGRPTGVEDGASEADHISVGVGDRASACRSPRPGSSTSIPTCLHSSATRWRLDSGCTERPRPGSRLRCIGQGGW